MRNVIQMVCKLSVAERHPPQISTSRSGSDIYYASGMIFSKHTDVYALSLVACQSTAFMEAHWLGFLRVQYVRQRNTYTEQIYIVCVKMIVESGSQCAVRHGADDGN